MIVNYSDQEIIKGDKSIFLAGPTPRGENALSWRTEAIKILESLGFDGIVYVPEYSTWKPKSDYVDQAVWERRGLEAATIIMFWVPRSIPDMYGFTTNVEFGYWLHSHKVLYGRPDGAPKTKYLDWLYRYDTLEEPINNLEELLKLSVERINKRQVVEYGNYEKILNNYYDKENKYLIVCDKFLEDKINNDLDFIKNKYIFTDFTANPKLEEIKKGIEVLKENDINNIIAIGGGSSIDVAKYIKLLSNLDKEEDLYADKFIENDIKLIAIPTTAGTGSESTKIAVMYINGVKKSVYHDSLVPYLAILDHRFLITLPSYQKCATLLDAMCQLAESYWSKHSTKLSREYSLKGIELIVDNYQEYLQGNEFVYKKIMESANLSGKAINITKTTAPHSMSYILTTKYGIAHGHAVFLCFISCFKYLYELSLNNLELSDKLVSLSNLFNCDSPRECIKFLEDMLDSMNLPKISIENKDIDELVSSVNLERLENNPIVFNKEELANLYKNIVS